MKVPTLRRSLAPFLLGLVLVGTAQASDLTSCAVPRQVTPALVAVPPADEVHPDEPIAAYLLALFWSPEACRAGIPESDKAIQCQANRFGFTVHGLWPNGADKVHPRYCKPGAAIRSATVKANLCMTPSPWLQQHEWQAHGTCAWPTPEAYFAKARTVRDTLRVPDLAPGPDATMTAGQVREAFLTRNPRLTREGLNVRVNKENRLTEVWVCLDLAFKPAACRGGNGTPDAVTVRVTGRG